MKKYTYLSLLLVLVMGVNINADLFPKQNEIGVGLSSGKINSLDGNDIEVDLDLGYSLEYGLTEDISVSLAYSGFDDLGIESSGIALGAEYRMDYLYDTTVVLGASVNFLEYEATGLDENGTSLGLDTSIVYTAIDYVKPYVGLSYLTDASSKIKFDDNLFEHVGFVITATDYLNIALDYEFTEEAITYGAEFLFEI